MDEHLRDSLIFEYFHLGMTQRDIVCALRINCGYNVSERHLRRILKKLQLKRRDYEDIERVTNYIRNLLLESGMQHGYRWLYHRCKLNGYKIKRDDVRIILSCIDPNGVQLRRARRLHRRSYFSKGPNYIWHVDGYDKLMPYGFGISGCIDGFSRYIIWLNVYFTNSDPKVVGGYFIDALRKVGGCPTLVRGDPGTENGHIKVFQTILAGENNNLGPYLEGSSTANQRIESFWGQLRKQCMQFWIALFQALREHGLFNGSYLDKQILMFCFLGILQDELDECVRVWNDHNIRNVKKSNAPNGRPAIMYHVPELYGVDNYLIPVSQQHVEVCADECTFRDINPVNNDITIACSILMQEEHCSFPKTATEAESLYKFLRSRIKANLMTV